MAWRSVPLDTHPEVMAVQFERFRAMSFDDRVALIEALHADLEALAVAGILMDQPGLDAVGIRRELVRRRYGDAHQSSPSPVTGTGPLALAIQMAALLEGLGIPHALGGSLASSLLGEPRSPRAVDIAISIEPHQVEPFVAAAGADFTFSAGQVREAMTQRSSFELMPLDGTLQVDLFVLGHGLLDRNQLARRISVSAIGLASAVWITSAEDQVLRKLDWLRRGDGASDQHQRDILGILRVRKGLLDLDYLRATAALVDLTDDLEPALGAAG